MRVHAGCSQPTRSDSGSTGEHRYIAPDLFIAETPLGTYQGMTDQIVMSRTPGSLIMAAHASAWDPGSVAPAPQQSSADASVAR